MFSIVLQAIRNYLDNLEGKDRKNIINHLKEAKTSNEIEDIIINICDEFYTNKNGYRESDASILNDFWFNHIYELNKMLKKEL